MSPVELLIAVTSIGLLMLLAVFFIDRSLALQRARDLTRFNDVQLYISSLLQYQIDQAGRIPPGIDDDPQTWQMIGIEGQICTDYCPNQPLTSACAFLPELVPIYVSRIPQDPFFTDLGSSGYYINKDADKDLLTVGACVTEGVPIIEQKQ